MTYDEVITRLEEMRPRYDAGFSTSDRNLLDKLYYLIYKKPITLTGCADCYRDAYLVIFNNLRRTKTMPEQTNYRLHRGVVLHTFGSSEYYTLDISDEVAEEYLAKDPLNIKDFECFPEDWQTRVEARLAGNTVAVAETSAETVETNAADGSNTTPTNAVTSKKRHGRKH